MPYADTDFFIALINPDDRHGKAAKKLYKSYSGSIYTSVATMIELALVAVKKNLDIEELIGGAIDIATVEGMDSSKIMFAAHLIANEKFGVFDAFHAALCRDEIISSDHIYDKLGIKRMNF
ncbi:MAG: type II toxin-antitoxin system VapC family toxin [Candidatus Micrarchaeota archaeon]|nr:type II toxin-antitoxin system VapC family toxin [Candidatus Micrarchaeota archaeon]